MSKVLKKWYSEKVSKRSKITFLSTFTFGLLAHLFMLTNTINNYDSITCTPAGYGTGITSGRWALSILGDIVGFVWGEYNVPIFNGIFSLIILSISAVIMVNVFEIKDTINCVLLGGISISFPAITSMFFFQYTAPYYSIAILLSSCATWLIKNKKIIAAIIALGFVLGIYQAYFPFAVTMVLLLVLQQCVRSDSDAKRNIYFAFRAFITLVGGLVFYFIMLQVMLFAYKETLSGYQGINEMGLNIHDIPAILKSVYGNFFRLPMDTLYSVNNTSIIKVCILFLYIFNIVLLILFLKRFKQNKLVIVEILTLCILFPIALNLIVVMCFNSAIYTLMVYSLVFTFILPIVLLETENDNQNIYHENCKMAKKTLAVCNWIIPVVLMVVILNYSWMSNGNYVTLHYVNSQTENYFSSLVTRVKSTDGYNDTMPLVTVGEKIEDSNFSYGSTFSETPFFYGGNPTDLVDSYSRWKFMELYLGYMPARNWEFDTNREDIKAMPCYPDDGSIKVIEGMVVVKFSEVE